MKKFLAVVLALVFLGNSVAYAHQPVLLLDSDTTAAEGPLLVDGTVSFAIRASFTKAGQKKAFRARFKAGDALSVQYLIVDKKPENKLKTTALPSFVITAPTGSSMTLKFTERTKFYEPFGKANYLYLARYSSVAEAGIYNFTITSKGKAGITVAVGDREVRGEVVRGAAPAPSQSATPSQLPAPSQSATPSQSPEPSQSATPSKSPAASQGSSGPTFTLADVKKNDNATNCWTIVDENVYNLTTWINSHPGGSNAILSLCGKDGTSAFKAQHTGRAGPISQLDSYKIGKLKD
ncbi:MAG: hypothetical protein EXQ80_05370 [Candidatus Nanopelagicaceae bacterium]|nr:hypothetical protein [Candidatus Nanopelagicaceae bacterium]